MSGIIKTLKGDTQIKLKGDHKNVRRISQQIRKDRQAVPRA
nr:MAG TPA: hypothetical protein [Caudoviricetes sp.]